MAVSYVHVWTLLCAYARRLLEEVLGESLEGDLDALEAACK
jgi:hypothetical protein